jgi:hypothetical protein
MTAVSESIVALWLLEAACSRNNSGIVSPAVPAESVLCRNRRRD